MKKALSIVLALMMLVAFCAVAVADDAPAPGIVVTSPEGWIAEWHNDYGNDVIDAFASYFASQGITDYFIVGVITFEYADSPQTAWPETGLDVRIQSPEIAALNCQQGDTIVLVNWHNQTEFLSYNATLVESDMIDAFGVNDASPFAIGVKRAAPAPTPTPAPAPAETSPATGETLNPLIALGAILLGGALLVAVPKMRKTK